MKRAFFEATRLVEAPPDRVWTVLADYDRDHEWRDGVRMTCEPAGLARDGTVTHERIRVLGSEKQIDAVVHDVVPGRSLRFRTTRAEVPARGERLVEPEGPGSRVTLRIEVDLVGFLALFRRPLAWSYRRRLAADLARLARLVEPSAPRLASGELRAHAS